MRKGEGEKGGKCREEGRMGESGEGRTNREDGRRTISQEMTQWMYVCIFFLFFFMGYERKREIETDR